MNRCKFLISVVTILLLSMTLSAQVTTFPGKPDPIPDSIPVEPYPGKIVGQGPKDPITSPVTCLLWGNCLSVNCNFDVMGEVTVYNNQTLQKVSSGQENLGYGVILDLDNYVKGAMTVIVAVSGESYIGYF
ncbi:MAG: hypothetical protein HDS18_02275 [Bacteroides sp.]|nr:hypothetical protein [Bacteroidales bacterium]MBD5303562.1 hypothetical protein [Bacteroides sp.]MBD5340199.1 hypothetical protein [Bacteroides sp.]